MFDVLMFAGVGVVGGVTFGTVLDVESIQPTPTRDALWRLMAWGLIGGVVGGLLALAFRLPVFFTPVP
jgi:hypothetical protein